MTSIRALEQLKINHKPFPFINIKLVITLQERVCYFLALVTHFARFQLPTKQLKADLTYRLK